MGGRKVATPSEHLGLPKMQFEKHWTSS